MTNKYNYQAIVCALFLLGSSTYAIADQIDEQQLEFLSEVNVAKNQGEITAKQAAQLDKEMKEFSKLKRKLKEQHADVLTAQDKMQLNQALNRPRQLLETMRNSRVPVAKSKSVGN
ncbi:MAG: hypothetical protein EKK48_04255 [Candidatus Melainabacteria bacterium]|nr:MAG: hypothetical protein EKK48_04255 [Candidatus Melainabacteria bacterium]